MAIIDLDYNLEEVSSSFEPVPAGNYEARIDSVELVTSQTNKPMLKVAWEITDGEFVGRKLFDNVVLTVPWKVKQYAEVAGIESGAELDTDDFVGAEGIVEVQVTEYNGEPRNAIKKVQPL